MKTKRRHDLHTNVLADWLGKRSEKVRPYIGWIVLGVLVVVALAILVPFYRGHSASALAEGWRRFGNARGDATEALRQGSRPGSEVALDQAIRELEQIAEEFSATPLAVFTNATIGDLLLIQGQQKMNADRPVALAQLERAVGSYHAALSESTDSLLKNRLLMSLGVAYEWLFRLDDAKRTYGQVGGVFEENAQQSLAVLEKPESRQIYVQLRQMEPKPPARPTRKPDEAFSAPGEDLLKAFEGKLKGESNPAKDAVPSKDEPSIGTEPGPKGTVPGESSGSQQDSDKATGAATSPESKQPPAPTQK